MIPFVMRIFWVLVSFKLMIWYITYTLSIILLWQNQICNRLQDSTFWVKLSYKRVKYFDYGNILLKVICGLFINAAYITGCIASGGRKVELKGCGRKRSWLSWGTI